MFGEFDGSWIDSAIVNGRGDLLIGLSDGEVINAGSVWVRGATGQPGPTWPAGAAWF